jgi:Transposase, Mutator family
MVDHIVDSSEPRGRVDIQIGPERRRRWSDEVNGRIVAESFAPGRGRLGGRAPARHLATASVRLAQGSARRSAELAGRGGAPTSQWAVPPRSPTKRSRLCWSAGGDHAMTSHITTSCLPQSETETAAHLFDNWFDPIEAGLRGRVRGFLQVMLPSSTSCWPARAMPGARRRWVRSGGCRRRHGSSARPPVALAAGHLREGRVVGAPRRLNTPHGKTTEWKSRVLRTYQRRTLSADALIASCYLAGTNTRHVKRALATLFAGAVSKDTVSRVGAGEERLGCLEYAPAGGGTDRAADSRRHRGARAARPQSDRDLADWSRLN